MSIDCPLLMSTRLFWHQSTTRICPCCLDEQNPYDRLYWRARPLSLCPEHRVFLIDQCPVCRAPIPALRLHPSLCPVCRTGDYREAVRPLPPELLWLYESNIVLLKYLGIELQEYEVRLSPHALSLCRHFSSQEYLELMERFWWLLHTPPMSDSLLPFLCRVFPIEGRIPGVAAPILLIHYLLTQWPLHFWMVLDAFHQALCEDIPRAKWLTARLKQWDQSFAQGKPWCPEASSEQVDVFFETADDYLNTREQSGRRDLPFGKTIVSQGILPVHPNQDNSMVVAHASLDEGHPNTATTRAPLLMKSMLPVVGENGGKKKEENRNTFGRAGGESPYMGEWSQSSGASRKNNGSLHRLSRATLSGRQTVFRGTP